jgi:DNA-binding NarL/FixJ family response regulator
MQRQPNWKDAATAELEFAVKAVARGNTYLSSAVSKTVIADYMQRLSGSDEGVHGEVSPAEPLTLRQREILQLIAEGHTTKEIATLLYVSVNTIQTHRKHLMKRLGVADMAGLVRYAIRVGVVSTAR